jgi:ABC-type nitrate/sulfonate/bicarbonate transport system permease component
VGPDVSPRSRPGSWLADVRRGVGVFASFVLSVAVGLAAWQLFLEVFSVDDFIGKGPADVWEHLTAAESAESRTELWDASRTTLRDAFVGLGVGSTIAVIVAIAFALWRGVEQTLMPVAMVLRSVPLVAMTPLIVVIFGRDILAVTVITGIVTFFATLVNVALALRSTPQETLDVCRAYGASPFQTLRKVQLPIALPALFASLRIAAPLALVGALLAEGLATGDGLGWLMSEARNSFQIEQLWSAVFLVTAYSVALYTVIGAAERLVLARFGQTTTT